MDTFWHLFPGLVSDITPTSQILQLCFSNLKECNPVILSVTLVLCWIWVPKQNCLFVMYLILLVLWVTLTCENVYTFPSPFTKQECLQNKQQEHQWRLNFLIFGFLSQLQWSLMMLTENNCYKPVKHSFRNNCQISRALWLANFYRQYKSTDSFWESCRLTSQKSSIKS